MAVCVRKTSRNGRNPYLVVHLLGQIPDMRERVFGEFRRIRAVVGQDLQSAVGERITIAPKLTPMIRFIRPPKSRKWPSRLGIPICP
jgi:hypothetical protein